jgi:Na+/proline symporter
VVYFYVAAGGIRSVAWVDALQAILLWLGIIAIGLVVMHHYGGWDPFIARITRLESKYLTVPAAWSPGTPAAWSGMFQLTYMMSLMGIMASPAFHIWSFSNKDPRPFPWQHVFASTLLVGFALIFFTAIQGLGGRALLEDGVLAFTKDSEVVPEMVKKMMGGPLAGFVVIGALAAMQSTAAAYMGTGGSILMRDAYVRYFRPNAGHAEQIWVGRLLVLIIVSVAMYVGLTNTAALVMLGGLATAFGFLLYLPLVDTLYLRKFTRQGVAIGLALGILAVILTFAVAKIKYAFNIHSAGWGGLVAFVTAGIVTAFTRRREQARADLATVRQDMTRWLDDVDTPSAEQKKWRRVMWWVVPIWFIFAIGPGMVLGNDFISFASLPPVWAWQVVWWVLGFVMMWALAFKAGLAQATQAQIDRANAETRAVVAEIGLGRKVAGTPSQAMGRPGGR